jgi:ribonuclease BN (tRNA processing enzyme)
MTMRLTIVGCGDAFGSGGRFNTCFKIDARQATILLDCGASSLVALKAHHIDPNAIDAIVLSHLHGDHFGGLPFLLLDAQLLSRRTRPLLIAGPAGTRARLEAALEVLFPRSTTTAWHFAWEVQEIVPGRPSQILGLTVETVEVEHPSGAPSTAVRLGDGERVLAYSGDTQWTEALLSIGRGADLFIVECYEYARDVAYHMNWRVLQPRLLDLGAKRVMITHLGPAMLAQVEAAGLAGVLVARDGAVIEI